MSNQRNFFKKPIIQFSTILLAISALTLSVIFSQSNNASKKTKQSEPVKIYPSSKSMIPNPPKEKSESKEVKQEKQAKDTPKKDDEKKIIQSPIVPSSKAPAPGEY